MATVKVKVIIFDDIYNGFMSTSKIKWNGRHKVEEKNEDQ